MTLQPCSPATQLYADGTHVPCNTLLKDSRQQHHFLAWIQHNFRGHCEAPGLQKCTMVMLLPCPMPSVEWSCAGHALSYMRRNEVGAGWMQGYPPADAAPSPDSSPALRMFASSRSSSLRSASGLAAAPAFPAFPAFLLVALPAVPLGACATAAALAGAPSERLSGSSSSSCAGFPNSAACAHGHHCSGK
jgi:hypothetical protein